MSADTDALVAFLHARLDEDEQTARAVQPEASLHPSDPIEFILAACDLSTPGIKAAGRHIAHHDPARVLADIAADRELLGQYERLLRAQQAHAAATAELEADIEHEERTGQWAGAGFPDVRQRALRREADYLTAMRPLLERWVKAKAARHADHEDYQQSWRP